MPDHSNDQHLMTLFQNKSAKGTTYLSSTIRAEDREKLMELLNSQPEGEIRLVAFKSQKTTKQGDPMWNLRVSEPRRTEAAVQSQPTQVDLEDDVPF